jgi:predicted RNase H-like HicB family nuclease
VRLTATIRKEGDLYVSQCIEVDVASQGDSVEQALANLREALELYFEDGGEIREPIEPTIIATIEVPVTASAG